MNDFSPYQRRARELVEYLGDLTGQVAVQAGGHVGFVPELLGARFASVYTFEPCPLNFAALVERCSRLPGVYAARGALGNGYPLELAVHGKSSGGHWVRAGVGNLPSYRVDELRLRACDLIALDVEGYELEILRQAKRTLDRFHPLVIAEENRQMNKYGRRPGELEEFLRPYGYRRVAAVGEDLVFEARR